MKTRRIKLVWGASQTVKGHWYFGLFGFYDRREGKHDDGLAISVRGAVLWTTGAVVATWLTGALVLLWFWERNPYNGLTYPDALLRPFRSEVVHDKQGQAYIAQGIDALRGKKPWEGKRLLEAGLALHPDDRPARLTLAQFYVATNQRPLGVKLLQDGLRDEFPGRGYLLALFDAAEQGEDYGLVTRTCERYLPLLKGEASARDLRWLRSRQFGALQGARQFEAVIALADAMGPGDVANENRVLALLALERREEALKFLSGWRAQPGADARQVVRLEVRTLRELGRIDEMEQALEELRTMNPADARPIVYGIVQRAMGGRDEAAKAALEDYFFRFGGSAANLLLVAEPLAEIGNLPLLERCVAAATERGYAEQSFQVLLVQANVQRGEWAAARRTLAIMKPPAAGRDAVAAKLWQEWMTQLTEAVTLPSDNTPLGLMEFLRNRPWSMKIFHKSIEALRLAGRWESARDAVALAERAFPASAWLQTQKEEIAGEIAARQRANAEPAAVAVKLPTEKNFFPRLEALLHEGQWTEAGQLIDDARAARPSPAWLATRDAELRFATLQICQARGDVPGMVAAARIYLTGSNERSQKLLDFGRVIFAKGDATGAVALGKEVLRKSPDAALAQRLLKEWQPTPAAKK